MSSSSIISSSTLIADVFQILCNAYGVFVNYMTPALLLKVCKAQESEEVAPQLANKDVQKAATSTSWSGGLHRGVTFISTKCSVRCREYLRHKRYSAMKKSLGTHSSSSGYNGDLTHSSVVWWQATWNAVQPQHDHSNQWNSRRINRGQLGQ